MHEVTDTQETSEKKDPSLLYMVKYDYSSETDVCRGIAGEEYEPGDPLIVPSRYGSDLARVLGQVRCPALSKDEKPLKVIRKATTEDLNRAERNMEKEKQAFQICKEKIEYHKLEMKLIDVHYLLDEPKGLFFFSAESRVDFRALVKDLVSVFKMRIELRQIGVRDESRVLGGIGVCGRGYCCHDITDKLKPVSIKMAKEQNLSLNSMKISGPCGRLLCCLSYEYDFYHSEKRKLPQEGSRILVGRDLCRITEINILSKKISVRAEDGRTFYAPFELLKMKNNKWSLPASVLEESEN